jgi:hypothetical protein
MNSPTLSLTSTLDVVGGQRHAPTALTPGKDPVPIVYVESWVGPRASEDVCRNSRPHRNSIRGPSTR